MTDFNVVLTDLDGIAMLDELAMRSNGGAPVALTLGRAASQALCTTYSDEASVGGDEKFRRGALAVKVRTAVDPALTVEEIALIKQMVAKLYGPVVVYAAWSLLDPASVGR